MTTNVRERFIVSLDSADMAADMLVLWDAVHALFPDRNPSIGYADQHLNVGVRNDIAPEPPTLIRCTGCAAQWELDYEPLACTCDDDGFYQLSVDGGATWINQAEEE